MPVELKNELEAFLGFAAERLRQGDSRISPEEMLSQWRERMETVVAVREGIADFEAGRSRPADDVLREIRDGQPER